MSGGRLLAYLALAAWNGGAGTAWTFNLANGFTPGIVTTTAIEVFTIAALVVMFAKDVRRGRIDARSSR